MKLMMYVAEKLGEVRTNAKRDQELDKIQNEHYQFLKSERAGHVAEIARIKESITQHLKLQNGSTIGNDLAFDLTKEAWFKKANNPLKWMIAEIIVKQNIKALTPDDAKPVWRGMVEAGKEAVKARVIVDYSEATESIQFKGRTHMKSGFVKYDSYIYSDLLKLFGKWRKKLSTDSHNSHQL